MFKARPSLLSIILFALALSGFLFAATAHAEGNEINIGARDTATVTCSAPPTTRSDGTPFPTEEIAGYRIYYGKQSGAYTKYVSIDVSDDPTQSPCPFDLALTDDDIGQNYLAMTTIDTGGLESAYSNEVPFSVISIKAPPTAPPAVNLEVIPYQPETP